MFIWLILIKFDLKYLNTFDINKSVAGYHGIWQMFTEVDNFNNSHTYTDVIKTNSVPEFNKKDYRGNQHEMDNFNWQMQYVNYKKIEE